MNKGNENGVKLIRISIIHSLSGGFEVNQGGSQSFENHTSGSEGTGRYSKDVR
jgi:hypothetical protein